jgi:hypothetical protein
MSAGWGAAVRWGLMGALCLAGAAGAGLLDSPPPTLEGGVVTRVVYRMGPVHHAAGRADTVVVCQNLADVPATLALEIFDEEDQRAAGPVSAVAPVAGSVTFATGAGAALDAVAVEGLRALDHGKARVSATTTKLRCQAHHHLRSADGTTLDAALELVKKVAFD